MNNHISCTLKIHFAFVLIFPCIFIKEKFVFWKLLAVEFCGIDGLKYPVYYLTIIFKTFKETRFQKFIGAVLYKII